MREWLAKAREDLEAGGVRVTATLSAFGTVSFLAQQAAEKALKALLIHLQVAFDKTHNLEGLLRLAEPRVPGIVEDLLECRELSPHAVATRYPGGPVVGRADAERDLALARRVVETVERHVAPETAAGRGGA